MKFLGKVTRVFKYVITFSLAYVCAAFIMLIDPSMRNVWIVSERGDDARDNGYFFFNYLLREHPEINAYVDGISNHNDTIDKTIDLLLPYTKGYTITTVGNSAGGYMAMLLGCALKAEKVFSFGGQFNLATWGRLSEN